MVGGAPAWTPGVELLLGQTAEQVVSEGERIAGVVVRDREGTERTLRAGLLVAADGRDSRVAELAGVEEKVLPHGRFAYGGYFEGAQPDYAPDGAIWMLNPHCASGLPPPLALVMYAAMPTQAL